MLCWIIVQPRPLTAVEWILAAQTLIQSLRSMLIRPQLLNGMIPTQRLTMTSLYCTKLISHLFGTTVPKGCERVRNTLEIKLDPAETNPRADSVFAWNSLLSNNSTEGGGDTNPLEESKSLPLIQCCVHMTLNTTAVCARFGSFSCLMYRYLQQSIRKRLTNKTLSYCLYWVTIIYYLKVYSFIDLQDVWITVLK